MRVIKAILILIAVVHFTYAGGGTLYGTVTAKNSGLAAAGATIQLTGTEFRAVTDASGYFEITDILPGTYEVSASHMRYKKQIIKNTIEALELVDKVHKEEMEKFKSE